MDETEAQFSFDRLSHLCGTDCQDLGPCSSQTLSSNEQAAVLGEPIKTLISRSRYNVRFQNFFAF